MPRPSDSRMLAATMAVSVDSWHPVHPPHTRGRMHLGVEKRSDTRSQKTRFCCSQSIPAGQAFANRGWRLSFLAEVGPFTGMRVEVRRADARIADVRVPIWRLR
ncbi:hypothetical protein KACC15558_12200 [Brevibacterium ammoniilyticum]|uniref:Uncharacterized protein n=1 Tax=Brevibacterium ammoniilyticum TaxID=1046555 RepID=A0ABP9TXY9_9MICO